MEGSEVYTLDNWKMGWPPSFSIAFLAQQKTHGQLIAANEISSIFMFVCIFSRNNPDVRFGANNIIIYIYILGGSGIPGSYLRESFVVYFQAHLPFSHELSYR